MATDSLDDEQAKLDLDRDRLALEKTRFFRESWWLEEGLVNQRLEWLLKSQAFIGAVYAYLGREPLPSSQQPFTGALLAVLPLFAALLCVFVLIGIWAAHNPRVSPPQQAAQRPLQAASMKACRRRKTPMSAALHPPVPPRGACRQ